MKSPVLILFMLFLTYLFSSFDIKDSDTLVIEAVGTRTGYVKIGENKENCAKGSTFRATDKVFLDSDEYLKVRNLRTRRVIEICYESFLKKNLPSGSSFIKLKMAASKSSNDFSSYISTFSPWYLIEDTVRIECTYKLNTTDCGFILRTIPGDKELTPVPFDTETNELILTSDYFFERNRILPEEINSLLFRMEYWNNGKVTPIASDLKFIFKQHYSKYQ